MDAYQRYQATVLPPSTDLGKNFSDGRVMAIVPHDADGVITHVEPRKRSRDDPNGWPLPWSFDDETDSESILRIDVILTTPVADPPAIVGVFLLYDARPRDKEREDVREAGSIGGVVMTALANDVDLGTRRAKASLEVPLASRLGWCRGSQCVVRAPTVLRPVFEPRLANGDVNAARWDRIATGPQLGQSPEPDEPRALEGTQEVEASRIPLTAVLDSASPETVPADNDLLLWRSTGELTSPRAKITDSDRALTQQNAIFVAGVEVGVATALAPWALQLLFEFVTHRRQLRRQRTE
ncbi:hypothetical protein [Saccharothrix variisporea]|uniref:hypothetical protein n=1 Tax=Saccharothrix variisporea TaxID=543527 RepID=UPI0011C4093C|nr:hypothetical protein [Saccharothrix variisporea]